MDESLSHLSLSFIEDLYAQYCRDPESVGADWRAYFSQQPGAVVPAVVPAAKAPEPVARPDAQQFAVQHSLNQLVRNYRVRGHMIAQLDPLGLPRQRPPELDPGYYGFNDADLDRPFPVSVLRHAPAQTLRQLLENLQDTYCRSIGAQFYHIDDLSVREWLQERMESTKNRLELSREDQIRILTRLTDAVIFEEFIQKKYTGAKSFSLEGAESLVPLLERAIEKAGEQGIQEVVLGMAHRGRLNVLANIIGKSPRQIFQEFEDTHPELYEGRGDVKYHLGYSSDWITAAGQKIHLSLCFNPSHLEFVNPVALGRVRAKQDRAKDNKRVRGLAVLIHGDAAFAGEGVIQETLNLSELQGYSVGGTVHVIINNQIGFTTSPQEARSTTYCTDVAKMLQIPIFHVNGEDPEAVAQVVKLVMEFRQTFQRDAVIDMYCYRRRGHNEGDEPAFTQPLLYKAIRERKSVRDGYLDHLLKLRGVTRSEADEIALRRRDLLEAELSVARAVEPLPAPTLGGIWSGYSGGSEPNGKEVGTGVEKERLVRLLSMQTQVPENFHPHPNIVKLLKQREQMARGAEPLNWAAAESLAFASLATEHHRVRLSGQDSGRGTFSHRHAVLYDAEDGHSFVPLRHLSHDQGPVDVHNSPLSEIGVLGFEYGYSLDCPDALVMWEAQFGDFVNVAQVIIDQFIASAEDKWGRLSGLVLLLPHGFEGMGPEHSSARLERFLALAAGENIQVVQPTTPAQVFHCLRRQVHRRWRKPLVVMTPKSLLRHPGAVSQLEELAQGHFQRVLPDDEARAAGRILLCSGKVYYELVKERERRGRSDVAILRLEELYPLPDRVLAAALAPYREGIPVVWVQEEPENMGAWSFLRLRYGNALFGRHPFSGVHRRASASPATGSASSHKLEQQRLLEACFGELKQ